MKCNEYTKLKGNVLHTVCVSSKGTGDWNI